MPTKFTKQWGSRPNIRHIEGRAYHYQGSANTKAEAERDVEYYRKEGRLARIFKTFRPEHALKGSLKFRGKVTIIPGQWWWDVYATVKTRRK
jgi:hypothetical protein